MSDDSVRNSNNFPETISTQEKALRINLDPEKFGAFAEIGAGQEVVRWFFHVGQASQTVAKSISAYDMVISDDLYGHTDYYVSRGRLEAMLNREWGLLLDRLDSVRGDRSSFFVFADTVATRSRSRHRDGHGWLGVRFQTGPRELYSEIIIHTDFVDIAPASEQEALGILGVNLIYSAFYLHDTPQRAMTTLMDGLSRYRVEIDMIKFSGPAFANIDNRLMSLQLVELGLTDAAMFTADGEVVQPGEVLYKKPVLMERGSFRPVTNIALDMLERALGCFRRVPELKDEPVIVMEMTLSNLMSNRVVDHRDFLARVDVLGALGKVVMVSNYTRFDRVTTYLRQYTPNWIGMVMGVPTLRALFDESFYTELDGGILEGLGRLFRGHVRLYIYPALTAAGQIETSAGLRLAPGLQHLFAYLKEKGAIDPIEGFDVSQLHVFPKDVLAAIQAGRSGWEQFVPSVVADLIRSRALFGYRGKRETD